MLSRNPPKMVNQTIESEKASVVVKSKNFFLVSDGSLAGTYVEINGKKVELLQNLTINWDTRNSIPTINMTSYLTPEKQNNKEDLTKIVKVFQEEKEIFDIDTPILDFDEKYVFGHWIIYKRSNQNCYTFILTDRFHYRNQNETIVSIADSVKYQSVAIKYLVEILSPIFKDCGIPLISFEPSKSIETIYRDRSYDLNTENLKVYNPIMYMLGSGNGFLITNQIKIFHDLPKNIFIEEEMPNEQLKMFKEKFKKFDEEIQKKELKFDSLVLIPISFGNNFAFDISFINPSCSFWPEFFEDTHSIIGTDLNLNESQKNMLSQEYLRFLNRIL